jgi:phage tail sheath protein FI
MAFLHGIETVIVERGPINITTVKTSVIGLVGIAPKGTTNALTKITTLNQGIETFGEQLPGFTIPQALAAIYAQGPATVFVVNVFDSGSHVTAVTDEAKTITGGKAKTTNAPVGSVTITGPGGTPSLTEGTDYSIDAFGNITVLDFTNMAEGSGIEIDYSHLDVSALDDADFVGVAGPPKTGFKMFEEAKDLFGFGPKILICPVFGDTAAVTTEMIAQAEALRGVTIIDAPANGTFAQALLSRGGGGTWNGFLSTSKSVIFAFPYVNVYDIATEAIQARPFSQYLAGVISNVDNTKGYWFSPSNNTIKGIEGPALTLTAGINDTQSEVNQLNEIGITTIFNSFGTGFRVWGNRNASWPSNTKADNFIAVHRTRTVVDESVEVAMLPFLDQPINKALIDAIRESVNRFLRTLIGRGALLDGSICQFLADNNPQAQVALGQLVFDNTLMPPVPAERITFQSFLDEGLLTALVESVAG